MKNNQQHSDKFERPIKSLLLLSVNFRLAGAMMVIFALWLVLNQLL